MFTGCLRPCLPAPATPGCSCSCSYPCLHPLLFSRILVCCCCLFVNHFRRFPADLCKTVAFFNCILHSSCKFRHQLRILPPCSRTPGSCFLSLVCVVQFSHICATFATEMCNTFAPSVPSGGAASSQDPLACLPACQPRPPTAAAAPRPGTQLHFIATDTDAKVCVCVCVRDPCIHDIHARFCAFNAKL